MNLVIREERKRRGWTLTEVTTRTGIATADLSVLERGLRPAFPGWRQRLSAVFGLPEEELFSVVGEGDDDAA